MPYTVQQLDGLIDVLVEAVLRDIHSENGPDSGAYADPPRDPATVAPGWRRLPAGEAISAHPSTEQAISGGTT